MRRPHYKRGLVGPGDAAIGKPNAAKKIERKTWARRNAQELSFS